MIFSDDLIFIHIGKTGGLSCAQHLLRHLRAPVYNCHHDAHEETQRLQRGDEVKAITSVHRHCTLQEALGPIAAITGKTLNNFTKVVAVIRHPYTLEYSFYKHLQKNRVRERRKDDKRLLELADGDFKSFVKYAPFHRAGHAQESFFQLNGVTPPNVELVRFEDFPTSFVSAVGPFCQSSEAEGFPHANRTTYDTELGGLLTEEICRLLQRKHPFMFDSGLYSRDPSSIFSSSNK
ncbi:hypothetical protein [Algiphilus sp.]|uniref:hypothetical protein n=1 Tax=Algiphilus sp. TaxID=1872431 RepID=UPI003B521188